MARPDRRHRTSLRVEALESREMPSVAPSAPPPLFPQHYSNIRIAELAYQGTPLDATETQLLQQSVDLVVQGTDNLGAVAAVAPNTPQLIYANLSNLYGAPLISWLTYADANGMSREDAFLHVAQATPFQGTSPSSQPVDWFWAVYQGGGNTWTDLTAQAHQGAPGGVTFAQAGNSLAVGYPEKYMEFNVSLASPAANGWSYVLQYPTAVDSTGRPTAWGTLTPKSDTTHGLTNSGTIAFDPPANWKTASLNGSPLLYYVRFLTTSSGTAPVANAIRGRDYTQSNDTNTGIIPAFDDAADTNHDGYLNDQEYAAAAAAGMYARFAYESRLFYPGYGQMRFATNPSNSSYRSWAAQYSTNFLLQNPKADGLFLDNSSGLPPAQPGTVIEKLSSYSSDYASLVQALGPHWILPNTGGGGTSADEVIQTTGASFQEGALRPLSGSYTDFEWLASLVAHEEQLSSPSPYLVLDSSPVGGSPTDPRTQLATLAEYYLLANPNTTYLDFFGGPSPATSWSEHWSAAAAFNIGQPTAAWSVATSGSDPSNPQLTYKIYQRSYTNGLVLYKPLSAGNGQTGTTADATGTTYHLDGSYYVLRSDGTLAPPVTSVWLRNGEGAILIKVPTTPATAPGSPASLSVSGLPSSAQAGQTLKFTVTARDAAGNVATGYRGTVNLSSSDLGAIMPASYTFTAADQGRHTFSVTLTTAGPQILVAADAAQRTVVGSAGLAVTPAAAVRLGVGVTPSVVAGQPATVTVTALDGFGNPVPGYRGTLQLTATDSTAVLPATYTFTAADQGTHSFALTLNAAGPQVLTATDNGGLAGNTLVDVGQSAGSSSGGGDDGVITITSF